MDDLRNLRVLAAVARTGSMTRAGEALGMSQQAASQRIRLLERQLGVALLVRSPRGSTLTETAALIAGWADEALAAADRFDDLVAVIGDTASAELSVAASLTIAEHLVPLWLTAFTRRRPDARVRLVAANSTAVVEAVLDGAVRLGFIEAPTVPAGLRSRVIASDELVVVVSPDHAWAARSRGITPTELARTSLIQREAGSGTRAALDAALRTVSPAEPTASAPAAELPTSAAITSLARTGYAPAVLSILSVRQDIASGALVRVPIRGLHITRPLTAIWTQHQDPVAPDVSEFLAIAAAVGPGRRTGADRRAGA